MKYDIFISYRREDSSGRSNVATARQFKMAFEGPPYNYKVFFDYSECTDNYFSDIILPAIRTCDFFVLVLTKDSLLRCSNEGDWVRREIEEAIAYKRKIIPITPDKECESFPPSLLDSLRKALDGLQITTIYTDHMFESCVGFLVKNRFHLNNDNLRRDKDQKAEQEGKAAEKKQIYTRKETTNSYNGHEYVDLGLPSGTLWATCNVGADTPEDYGDYYAWGETTTKSTYNWDTYKFSNGECDRLTKYYEGFQFGKKRFVDNQTILQSDDDPATANLGSGWCTPKQEQWIELMDNTTNKWTTQNGIKGWLFTSKKNRQTMFLPAAGYRWDVELESVGLRGSYWSSSLVTFCPSDAWGFDFNSDKCFMGSDLRKRGQSIRAVCSPRRN